jgi:hypothetical protein
MDKQLSHGAQCASEKETLQSYVYEGFVMTGGLWQTHLAQTF